MLQDASLKFIKFHYLISNNKAAGISVCNYKYRK